MIEKKKVFCWKFLICGGFGIIGVLVVGIYVFRNFLCWMGLEMVEIMIFFYLGSGIEVNLWFEIIKENKVVLYFFKVEMG